MQLVFPYRNEIDPMDAKLMRLADCVGASYRAVPLDENGMLPSYVRGDVCLVVNAATWRLQPAVFSRFRFVLAYNFQPDDASHATLKGISGGAFESVRRANGGFYRVSGHHRPVLGAFSGLAFGPTDRVHDNLFTGTRSANPMDTLVSIDGGPVLVSTRNETTEFLLLARTGLDDVGDVAGTTGLSQRFSGLLLPLLVLRYLFGKSAWHPAHSTATLIIDDPQLKKNYGFLDYHRLVEVMDRHDFHTTIAFIPFNHRTSSPSIARLFRERADRYSICYHGNDHTKSEFATGDLGLLNSMLATAIERMGQHEAHHGISCGRVMVFPQGAFSRPALTALKRHNFDAAINSGWLPYGEAPRLKLADLVGPGTLAYDGFPLFHRHYVGQLSAVDIASCVLTGQPVFLVEHHEVFRDMDRITDVVAHVRKVAPGIRWTSADRAVRHAYLQRFQPSGCELRPYSTAVELCNESPAGLKYAIDWGCGLPDEPFELPPGAAKTILRRYGNDLPWNGVNTGFKWRAKAFVRRSLSDLRDMYLCRHPKLQSIGYAIHSRLFN